MMDNQIVMNNNTVLAKHYDIDKSCGLPVGEFKKKTCALCKELGHNNKFECSEFKFRYGVAPLKKNDKKLGTTLLKVSIKLIVMSYTNVMQMTKYRYWIVSP